MMSAASARSCQRATLFAENAVGDQHLVGEAVLLDEFVDRGVAIDLTRQVEHFNCRRAPARGQIGGIGLQVIAVAADQQKLGAARGGQARIGLRDRRGAAEDPNNLRAAVEFIASPAARSRT